MSDLNTEERIETAQSSSRSLCARVRFAKDDKTAEEGTVARDSLLKLSDQETNDETMRITHPAFRVVALGVFPIANAIAPRFFKWSVHPEIQDSYVFFFVIQRYYNLIHISAITQTCHTALKHTNIPIIRTALVVAVSGSLVIQMLVDLCISQVRWPIPFTLVSTAWVPFLTVPGILYSLIPDRTAYNIQFKLLGLFLFYILTEMALVGCWAVALAHTQQALAQIALTGVVSLIRAVCKIKFVASVATQLNERENIMLMLVVDFVAVPVVQSVFPYIENVVSLQSVSTNSVSHEFTISPNPLSLLFIRSRSLL